MRRTFIEVSADCTIHSGVQRCFEAFRSAIKIHTSSGIDIRSTTVSETRLTLARVPERMILLYPRRARATFRITDFEGINAGLPNYYSRCFAMLLLSSSLLLGIAVPLTTAYNSTLQWYHLARGHYGILIRSHSLPIKRSHRLLLRWPEVPEIAFGMY